MADLRVAWDDAPEKVKGRVTLEFFGWLLALLGVAIEFGWGGVLVYLGLSIIFVGR